MTTKLTDYSENRRILVVDDNVLIHDDFRKILQPGNEAHNFDEARAAVFGGTPRLKPLLRFELAFLMAAAIARITRVRIKVA